MTPKKQGLGQFLAVLAVVVVCAAAVIFKSGIPGPVVGYAFLGMLFLVVVGPLVRDVVQIYNARKIAETVASRRGGAVVRQKHTPRPEVSGVRIIFEDSVRGERHHA